MKSRPQYAAAGVNWGCVLVLLVGILVPISLVAKAARYFKEMSDERRRLRIEVSKLAHELEGLRADRNEADDSST